MNLLTLGTPGSVTGGQRELMDKFEHGTFEVLKHNEAIAIAELAQSFNFFSNWRSRDFVIAIYRIWMAEKISFNEVVAAVKNNSNMLTQQANFKEYIFKIEQIVNIGKRNRIILT